MRKIGKLFVASAMLFSVGTASAQDWQFTAAPALDFAFKKSDSSFLFFGVPYSTEWTGSPSYTAFVPSLAMSFGPIYSAISYDNPLAAWHSTSADFVSSTFNDTTYSRKEATLTVGYRTPWSVNAFLGYVHGRSEQTTVSYAPCNAFPCSPDPATFTFDERGLYLGASYSRQFGDKGTLSVSGAYGLMDGKMEILDTSGTVTLTSKSPGYSLGLSWTGPLTGSMVYRTGLKVTKYTFQFDEIAFGGPPTSIPKDWYELEEMIYTFTIGFANYF